MQSVCSEVEGIRHVMRGRLDHGSLVSSPGSSRAPDVLHQTAAGQEMASRATDDSPSSSGEESDAHDGASGGGIDRVPHLAKGLARYALSCEHSRRPIKRQDINERGTTAT